MHAILHDAVISDAHHGEKLFYLDETDTNIDCDDAHSITTDIPNSLT